jgi:hypothetical protein
MASRTRLEKAINGLNEIVNRNNMQDKFIFSTGKIIINRDRSFQLAAILLMTLILILPIGLILFYLIVDEANSIIFWLLLLEILFVNDFYKLLRGSTTLTIDFQEKFIQTDNTLTTLKKIFPSNYIHFSEIEKADLKEKSISWQQQWFQLIAFDKDRNEIVLTDFQKNYPESFIAEKVKFLFEVIIWTEKRAIVHEVSQN